MKRVLIFILSFSIFSTVLLGAQTPLDELLKKLELSDKKIQTLEFDFSQEIFYTVTKEKQSISGRITFKKPDNIYLKQVTPVEQYVVSNGKKVWIYTPAYNQAVSDSWGKWTKNSMIPSSLMNFGEALSEMKKNYKINYSGVEGEDEVLVLEPLNKDSWKLKLWVNSKSLMVHKTRLEGDNISVNTTALNYKINPVLDKNMFTFKPPYGVQVMELP